MNTGRFYLILISVMFAFSLRAAGQQPVLYFKRLNQASGLSHNKVNCIIQDKRGFTWIGTDDGLNRYDGHNFLVFKNIPGKASSISGNTITDLHEDKDGILWIATADGGISRYDHRMPPEKKFQQFKHQPGDSNSIPVNIVNALEEGSNGDLWLATSGAGVIRFDKQKEKFLKPARIGTWTINDMAFDKKGMIWAGREGGSILKVDPSTMQWQMDPQYNNIYASLPHVVVTRLFRDSKQNIWFGSWDKAVYRYNALTGIEESFVHDKGQPYSFGLDEATAFNEDREGRIWIGGKYFGLYLYDPALNNFYNYRYDPSREGSLSDNKVNCIFIDPSGIVWVGTNNGISICHGGHRLFEQQFLPRKGAETNMIIYDFFCADDGSLWIGTSNGLYIRDINGIFNHKNLTYKGKKLSITKIFRDNDGSFYLGTNHTLFLYDPQSGRLDILPNTEKDQVMSQLIESRIVSIEKDTLNGHPILWTAPYGHFFTYYDFTEKRWVSRRDSVIRILDKYQISDNLIRKILKGRDGRLWFANAKSGLVLVHKHDKGNTTYINNPSDSSSISNNNVFDIKEDQKGNLWVSTYGGGLNYFDTKTGKFEHYSSVQNLLEGLSIDKGGNVWIICNGHLQKFDPRSKTFSYFELPDLEKTGGVKGHIYQDFYGRMYVAGSGYFIPFDPSRLTMRQNQPQVYLTDLSIFNRSYSHLLGEKMVTLRHNQNFFTIHFSAPYYAESSPVQYAYMLEGVDQDWVYASTSSPQAQYTNLGGGEYVFKVRATATPGTWSEKITTINIRIIPPFWKRGWFFLLLALGIAFITYGIYRYRINELLKRQAIRNKIAQDLHDNMGSTLSSISVYSQVAKIYKQKERQDELQHTLEKISTISGEMISEMNDIVWAINPRNDSMDTILQRMDSFAKPLLASQGIQFHLRYDSSIRNLNLEMTKRKNFYLIFKEAVNNALKYSEARNLWVDISSESQYLVLTIKDDGKGFDTSNIKANTSATLGGNGLQNMQIRAKEADAAFQIESKAGEGTFIKLRMPIP
jgi:ligand-binding sensor domain-containing protein/two-component sensor histidine kinase